MDNFAEALAAIRDLKNEGVVSDYAIGGAMALSFWVEAVPTYDLDVFVLFPSDERIMTITPIYEWAGRHGYEVKAEHIEIAGIPVQVLPAHDAVTEEAIASAVGLPYGAETTRVMRPEYLIAMFLEKSARSAKRLARVAMLLESDVVDHELLSRILERHNLKLPRYDDGD